MTAHELAAILLAGPDITVSFWEYMGGDDELREVKQAKEFSDDYTYPQIVLKTYEE